MARPENLKYTPTHEWLRVEGELAVVGITDFAVEQLSDLVFIDLPAVGDAVVKDSRFGEIESTKTVSDLISPVSGTVVEVNQVLADQLEVLSRSPFEQGWMVKVRMSKPDEAGGLLSAADYQAQLGAEER
ncbi:MAG: glycine cleavage system protein GcvH [Thermoanaerobaculia bacterium]